jgi:hypothetical protein
VAIKNGSALSAHLSAIFCRLPRGRRSDAALAQPAPTATPQQVHAHSSGQARTERCGAIPVSDTIELRYRDSRCSRFRVPEWKNPPEIIECSGRRFVIQSDRLYCEAATFTLYVGYNAEAAEDGPASSIAT